MLKFLKTWSDVADYSLEGPDIKSKHSPLDVKKFLTGRHRPGPMELNIRSTRKVLKSYQRKTLSEHIKHISGFWITLWLQHQAVLFTLVDMILGDTKLIGLLHIKTLNRLYLVISLKGVYSLCDNHRGHSWVHSYVRECTHINGQAPINMVHSWGWWISLNSI